ncbi:MAG: LysR family transcriptional regulator [Janthinobacterium lividum]
MRREEMADLTVFLAVAEARSFTRAASKLGLSQSALSQIVRRLEERLGMRLLTRTTRSVEPTEAGDRLIDTLGPALDQLDASIAALSELSGKPTGTIRITSVEHATKTVLWPVLKHFLVQYPDVKAAINSDYGLVDIVAERYDAGVRMGEHVDKDMIAVRIAPAFRAAIVGSPAYFKTHPRPKSPQELVAHQGINLGLSASRGYYIWHFKKKNRELKVRVDGAIAFNNISLMLDAALAGFGLAYLPEDEVNQHIENGSLIRVLDDWCPLFPGYHLYYPSRRQQTPAFSLFVEALKHNLALG